VSANHQAAGNSSHQQQQQFNDHDLNYNNSNNMPDQEARTIPLITHHMNKQSNNNNNNNNTNNIINILNSSMAPSLRITSHIATNMLVAISMSWLILNLPYFIVWCIFTLHIMIKAENIEPAFLYQLSQIKTITEMFVLMNYSMAGLLYFVSGKMYREHLYAILGCAARRKRLSLSRVL
jgi:ATP-dependent Zn protease